MEQAKKKKKSGQVLYISAEHSKEYIFKNRPLVVFISTVSRMLMCIREWLWVLRVLLGYPVVHFLNTLTLLVHRCVVRLGGVDRLSLNDSVLARWHLQQGCLWRGQPTLQTTNLSVLSGPETIRQRRPAPEYNPRGASAGQSRGTPTAEQCGVLTGETRGHYPLYLHHA